jgi:hypothetical protein
MTTISKPELDLLDERIDAGIASFTVLQMPRPIVLLQLLRLYEDHLRLGIPQMVDAGDTESFSAARKMAQDGMNCALVWSAQQTPKSDLVDLELHDDAYELCIPMFMGAMQYSHVWDLMVLLFQGRASGEWSSVNRIELRYTDPLSSEFDVAGRVVAPPDPPGHRDRVKSQASSFEELLLKLNPRHVGGGKVGYELPPDVFGQMKEIHRNLLSHLWELDPSWDFGGYTLSQFREVWLSLVTFSFAHQYACWRSGAIGGGIRSLVPVKKIERWEKDLARWSGVSLPAVRQIINDLTFAVDLHGPGIKNPDVTYQPVVPLGQDLLALSSSLVLDSNAERNLWDLLSITKPGIHGKLRNEKERHWEAQLVPWLEGLGLECWPRLPVKLGSEETDLDLLIIDRSRKFGLGCQLKWLTAPDRIRDVGYTDKELVAGLDQADLSLRWLMGKPNGLEGKLRMTKDEVAEIHFEAAVLSKNALGSSVCHRKAPNIPVITERLLKWILGDPYRESLAALWHTSRKRSYFPVLGEHYSDEDFEADFNGVEFRAVALGMRNLKPWTPENGIKIAKE